MTPRIRKLRKLALGLEREAARLESLLSRTPGKYYANRVETIAEHRADAGKYRQLADQLEGVEV